MPIFMFVENALDCDFLARANKWFERVGKLGDVRSMRSVVEGLGRVLGERGEMSC